MGQNLFTGKDVGVLLPSGESGRRSQENMSSMILQAEKLKYDAFQKNKDQFLKDSKIDPVFVINDSKRQAQFEALDNFNKTWGKRMQETGYNLSLQDQVAMARDKDIILMNQQKMEADSQAYISMRDAMQKDVQGNLDHKDIQKRLDDYQSTGTMDTSPLLPSAIDPDEDLNKATNKVNGTPSNVTVTKNIGGVPYKETYQASGSEQEGREKVKNDLLSNDRKARGYIEKFQKLKDTDPETYKRYLDTDKNGIVSPSEENAVKTASNPILQWAQDTYWHKALDMKLSQSTKVNTGTASSGNMRTWQGSKYTPTSAMESPFPSMPSKEYHPLPNISKQITIPISNMELLEPDKSIAGTEKPNQSIKGFVTGYDEASDKITFLISQDYKDLDYPTLAAGKGMQIAVPRSAFSKEIFDDLEIVKDGNPTKLKDVKKSTQVSVKKKLY